MRPALLLACALLASQAEADVALHEAVAGMDLFPCDFSALSCTTLTLPLDHFANDPTRTIDITFALSFASVESRGILFYFVGGPGGSGVASADNYLASFDETLTQYTDIVFFDQRGTGPVHGLSCPNAQTRFDVATMSLDAPDAALLTARTYVEDCISELEDADLLPFVNSDQAIRDAEAFRRAIGAPKVWLYGESYGTQLAQAYATAFPHGMRGVILDGVVDLTLDAEAFYARYTQASERHLDRMFEACRNLSACRADMLVDPALAYADLDQKLSKGPLPVTFAKADGSRAERFLTKTQLESNAFFALYSSEGRAAFLRALAAAGRDDLGPMLQLGYQNMYIDPETETGFSDASWYPAAYFAITCSDYDSGTGTPDERAAQILEEAREFQPNAPRLSRWYYAERLVCAYWPNQGPAVRPAPYAGGDWPTFVLNGDGDPITPISMAYSVVDNARNAFGIFMTGGPHVIWGRGYDCPDKIIDDALQHGILPSVREQRCEQSFLSDYVPLTFTDPATMADPLTVARAVETELSLDPRLNSWDGAAPLAIGCRHGGTATIDLTETGTGLSLDACRLWPDLAMSGTAEFSDEEGRTGGVLLDLRGEGRHQGTLIYELDSRTGASRLSGTWDGRAVELPRLVD